MLPRLASPPFPRSRQHGISLVEAMVGMAIGLVASLVIMKSFTASEMFRQNVAGAADSTQTAAIVGARLNMLLEEGGASFVQGRNVWGCSLLATKSKTKLLPAPSLPDPFSTFPTALRALPVGILDGGSGSDIVVVMGGSSGSGNRDIPFSVDALGTSLVVNNPNGVGLRDTGAAADDLLLTVPQDVASPGDCQIVQVASTYSGGAAKLDGTLKLNVMPAQAAVVAPASYTTIALNAGTYGGLDKALNSKSPSAFHLGREAAPMFSLISVNANGELVEYDLLQRRGTDPLPFGENVVLMKARYGVDDGVGGTANDNVIDEWVAPNESGWKLADLMNGNVATVQKIDQIKAVRVAVVVRASQQVLSDVKPSSIVLFSDLSRTRTFTLELDSTAQRYGYQVFDWVIPLRNMKSTPK